ncbi:hypothetical protein EVAR_100153_1 [Eumeta japonica]|uniref:Uncharacterized protein n=1 Tax=Eumeta variegata TaxID=151549 RepID=A0A4C1ZU29_EUMVA|nr:hypothetical protein EVAR_100153_1 [Eumeta japonica]
MPEWKGRVPLTRSHCERITRWNKRASRTRAASAAAPGVWAVAPATSLTGPLSRRGPSPRAYGTSRPTRCRRTR